MCGLNAIFSYHEAAPSPLQAELIATRDAMVARGPDGQGVWRSRDGRCSLGHRRLAILDPDERAAQPMISRCGRYVLAYNGEIYNYPDLRAELLACGVPLRTKSDTEVLLELFARDGCAAFSRLIGMFAVAIWDDLAGQLFLARDSYGIKPLYYADDGWTIRAASQVKALLAGNVGREPEPAGIVGFLLWGSVPEPFTLYQQVRAIPPGHVVKIDAKGVGQAQPFLSLERLYNVAATDKASCDGIHDAVVASVQRHLIADVPVGLFLSSGIDSAAILAAIHAIDPARAAVTTAVTLGFKEYVGTSSDETPLAAKLAAAYGAKHVTRLVDQTEFTADLPYILEAMDQPSIDGVNAWFVSKAAAENGLKVALSGVGGDELFGGYPSFRDVPRWRARLALPANLPGIGFLWETGINWLLVRRSQIHPKLAGLMRHGANWAGVYFLRRGLYLPSELQEILDHDLLERGLRRLGAVGSLARIASQSPSASIPRVSLMESALYMRNQLLRDADWASMAHSLEVRMPFVDVELLRQIRPCQPYLDGKRLLAEALKLPECTRTRSKTGFTTPVGAWMRSTLNNTATEDSLWARRWARSVLSTITTGDGSVHAKPFRAA